MLPTPPAKSGNSARANDTSTRSAVTPPRHRPLLLKVVGSAPEALLDLCKTLRRQISEPPRMDATFAGVSPIPASSKDATPRKCCDPHSPFAAPPNFDGVGRVQTVPIPTALLESLVANTALMTAIISNREHALHEKGFVSFSSPANPTTEAAKRNQRRQRARKKKAKLNPDSTPIKPRHRRLRAPAPNPARSGFHRPSRAASWR